MDIAIISLIYSAEIIHGQTYGNSIMNKEGVIDEDMQSLVFSIRTLYSFAAIIMWLRLLYFFRIFRDTGYYIRMLVEVIKDIKYFIFIFALTIVAFAHAWFVFLKNGEETELENFAAALGYVYNLALGEFS